jgi:hypothetical protein
MFTAPYVIRGFNDNAPFAANEFQHNAWFVANLFLNDRPKPRFARDFPLAWDNVFYESPSLGYVNATHQKGSTMARRLSPTITRCVTSPTGVRSYSITRGVNLQMFV